MLSGPKHTLGDVAKALADGMGEGDVVYDRGPDAILAALESLSCKRRREVLRLALARWCPNCGRARRGECPHCKGDRS